MPEEPRLVEIHILKMMVSKLPAKPRKACTVACPLLSVARDARWRSDSDADVLASAASAASALGFYLGNAVAACISSASSADLAMLLAHASW